MAFRTGGIAIVMAILGVAAAEAEEAASPEALAVEARGIVGRFADKLKGELVGAMKEGGPVAAISVCNTAAPAIASEASTGGWIVRRTSLKLRNPATAPDAWEAETLARFDAAKAGGADPTKLERAEVLDNGGQRTFRYMKAIPTAAEPCLACHGTNLAEPVKAKLAELYPDDKATGYSAGDIRGAFTLTKPLP
ncbi:DUF3365 domain-containing protein [Rhodomicrobium vannielii ATCC 17100]|uniref:Tll0287-like domain-containing protein n=1 Tax=Rhodomicrobium vannielii TaxID=1069 RepID=UPI0019192551|nr:DUF3365 domain-containing protein [Rhodomicrobium vannielii]MBJ7533548.1 DUF3365 domain-containing protein [Rhodomicrobium vannielii ATCC 17100]